MENELFELKWYLKDGYKELCEVLEREQCCVFQATMGLGKSMIGFNYGVTYSKNTLIVSPRTDISNEWKKRYPTATCITFSKFYRLNKKNNYMVTDEYSLFDYDLLIIDECHHSSSASWRKNIELLKEKSDIKILGLTADTIRYLDDMLDVAEDLFDGNIVKSFNFYEAIEHGVLPGFRYIGCRFISYEDFFDLSNKIKENDFNDSHILINKLSDCIINDEKIVEILKEEMPKGEKKGIVFSANIEAISHDKKLIEKAFPGYKIWVIHSKMKRNIVEKKIEEFKEASVGFLITVNMVSEGFHPDGINCLISFRKTASFNLLMQQWGRIMSKDNLGKDIAIADIMASAFNIKVMSNDKIDNFFENPFDEYENKVGEEDEGKKKIITKFYCEEGYDIMKQIMEQLSDNWTEEEDKVMRKLYAEKGVEAVHEVLPHRTIASIRNRAKLLGLTNNLNWTEEEDEVMHKLYIEKGAKAVHEVLPHRSEGAIITRAKKLGLKINKLWTEKEDEVIYKLFLEKGAKAVHEVLPHRSEGAIRTRAYILGLTNCWTEEEEDIVRKLHPDFEAIQKALPNRTRKAIIHKSGMLGLTCMWTKEEEDIVRKLHPDYEAIQKALPNRSKGAIIHKARKLGLR